MESKQLALFGEEDIVGSGRPLPWPAAASEPEPVAENPDQLAFDQADGEAAA